MIINTHTHGDHVSGNVEFPATVEVVTHENTAKNMETMRPPTGITPAPGAPANIFKENGGRGTAEADLQGHDDAWQRQRPHRPALLRPRTHERRRVRRVSRAARDACRRHLLGQERPAARRRQRRQWRRNRQDTGEGRRGQGRRSDHHRAQHGDDRCRPQGVRGVQQRFRRGRAGGEEGGTDARRDRHRPGRSQPSTKGTRIRRRRGFAPTFRSSGTKRSNAGSRHRCADPWPSS